MKNISVIDAIFIAGYKINLVFSDGTSRIVDFHPFLSSHSHPQYDKYKKPSYFKSFKIEMGNIVWGKNRDLIFPVYDLYAGKV